MYIQKVKNLHFVGIGGSGMSGIAEVLLNMGFNVSGSDLVETGVTRRLQVLGGRLHIGHEASYVHGAQVVVSSSAIRSSNPEILEAHRQKIPVIPRAEMLAELMRMKYGIAVAGAHGKTTTTSLIANVLAAAGLDPTAVVGGRLDAFGSNARLGQGEFLVAEADESDGTFLHLTPTWAVITNIDREHLDYYSDLEAIRKAFAEFANKVPFYGAVILGTDDGITPGIVPLINKRIVTCGLDRNAEVRGVDLEHRGDFSDFNVHCRGRDLGRLHLRLPGRHNVSNALAAVAVGMELDLAPEKIFAALESFRNAHRRFEIKGEYAGIMVVDDYGHHPTEIRATLEAATAGWGRRIIAAFQPHRYTRSRDLASDFVTAFDGAATLLITEIYSAGEDPIAEVSAEALFRRIRDRGRTRTIYVPERQQIAARLLEVTRPGDMVITMGAGDIGKTSEELCGLLRERDDSGHGQRV